VGSPFNCAQTCSAYIFYRRLKILNGESPYIWVKTTFIIHHSLYWYEITTKLWAENQTTWETVTYRKVTTSWV